MNRAAPRPPDMSGRWGTYKAEAESPSRRDPYLKEPFPTALDDALDAVVTGFRAMSGPDRKFWKAHLTVTLHDSQLLLTYAIRMATQAIREGSSERIINGLVAHVIEGERDDWRENIIALTLLYDAARKLGADPLRLFHDVASLAPAEPSGETLKTFRKRKADVLTIESMGYTLAMTPQGVRYEPDPTF